MSGMFFTYPGVRFSPRIRRVFGRMFAPLLICWRSHAARRSLRRWTRPRAAEFPAATRTAYERLEGIFRDLRAADRASIDALRPNCNSVNTEDLYGISIIREGLAPWARWFFPPPERRSFLPAKIISQGPGQEVVLGQNHGLFLQWESPDRAGRAAAQWFGFAPGGARAVFA